MDSKENPGLGWGIQGPLRQYKSGQRVRLLRGKNKNDAGVIQYQTTQAPLSSERRYYISLEFRRNFWGPNHVLMNESGFSVLEGR